MGEVGGPECVKYDIPAGAVGREWGFWALISPSGGGPGAIVPILINSVALLSFVIGPGATREFFLRQDLRGVTGACGHSGGLWARNH